MCPNQLEKNKEFIIRKNNRIKFPVFYNYAICKYAKTNSNSVHYNRSIYHNTNYYSVYSFYKHIIND